MCDVIERRCTRYARSLLQGCVPWLAGARGDKHESARDEVAVLYRVGRSGQVIRKVQLWAAL
jgi:hypothetical protein